MHLVMAEWCHPTGQQQCFCRLWGMFRCFVICDLEAWVQTHAFIRFTESPHHHRTTRAAPQLLLFTMLFIKMSPDQSGLHFPACTALWWLYVWSNMFLKRCKVSLCSCEKMPARRSACPAPGCPSLWRRCRRSGKEAGQGSRQRDVTGIEIQMEERCKVEEQSRDLRNRPEEEEAGRVGGGRGMKKKNTKEGWLSGIITSQWTVTN